jgi:hypothetical protein
MSSAGAASLAALIPARAAASRKNGARSRGPKTPEGKARSARNALRHGLCAQQTVALGDEDLAAFDALEAALMAELAPQGVLQTVLARRIVAATWRLERAERIEAGLFAHNIRGTTSFGLAMIRDCNGARAFDTLLRYRGGTLAELWRALRTLKALQAEAAAQAGAQQEAVAPLGDSQAEMRIKPKTRRIPGESAPAPKPAPAPGPVGGDATRKGLGPVGGLVGESANPFPSADAPTGGVTGPDPFPALAPVPAAASAEPAPAAVAASVSAATGPAPQRIEPKRRTNPGKSARSMPREIVRGVLLEI